MAIQDRIFGHVDRLGYLRCAACADASDVTHAKDRPVTCAPHSEEPCDKCGRRLDAPPVDPAISAAAATLGRKGGQANTPAQFRSRSRNAAINGKKGGRPLGSKSAQHGPYRIVIRPQRRRRRRVLRDVSRPRPRSRPRRMRAGLS